jgi:hypothetical protein
MKDTEEEKTARYAAMKVTFRAYDPDDEVTIMSRIREVLWDYEEELEELGEVPNSLCCGLYYPAVEQALTEVSHSVNSLSGS